MNRIDTKGFLVVFVFTILSLLFSFFFQEKIRFNKDLLNLVANVFSILTGFLLLVLSMSSEAASILEGLSKTERMNQKKRFNIRFARYCSLFFLYFSVLVLIFIYYAILPPEKAALSDAKHPISNTILTSMTILEYLICFLTSFSFLLSTLIPLKIREIYEEKMLLNSNDKNGK
ncbi:TPA: hypothetical protein PXQ76_002511 [Yersinia enterocolitica]|uniref:Uncharacterized protein n=1 Tax=Yersinia kristensenii TaxID=28152 RepID=A0A0T9KZM8_YERKR|nr:MULTISPECIES: hypothetical protein [Yersinia]CNE43114.1 Uncharacterised protein [Yersinia kristensenii]CNK70273.1 Uncharacterised protein [Yersinia enterocolitica]CRY30050.1 Uncharacterised protein [Yersinia enterocolitica]HDL7587500.1 hypothetical protein [Yersinia enterocolitica]HDL8026151.1 hypothetical protein [Yersinia enterocolitica]